MSISVHAADKKNNTNDLNGKISIAYMEIENASDEMRAHIIAAREEIIFSESWVADGLSCYICDEDGNIKEVLPQFSDLFPADWDLPVLRENENEAEIRSEANRESVNEMSSSYDICPFFEGSIRLVKPSDSAITSPFCRIATTGFPGTSNEYNVETIYVYGVYGNLQEQGTYNVGCSNATTGVSLSHATRVSNGDSVVFNPPSNITVGVRASTYDSVGSWNMQVIGKRVFANR